MPTCGKKNKVKLKGKPNVNLINFIILLGNWKISYKHVEVGEGPPVKVGVQKRYWRNKKITTSLALISYQLLEPQNLYEVVYN